MREEGSMRPLQAPGAVAFAAVTLIVPGCGGPERLVQPTAPAVAPRFPPFSISGTVVDTVYRPIAGARVVTANGPGTATAEFTDEAGRFSMPGTFTDVVTLTASKDGYFPETRQIPPRMILEIGDKSVWETQLQLAPTGSKDVTGVYTLTV